MKTTLLFAVLLFAAIVCGQTTQPATAPAGTLLFGFENNSAGPFTGENVVEGPTIVAENATEGTKSLMISFDSTDTTQRPTFKVNKPKAFSGAKTISFDVSYVGEDAPKAKLRFTLRDLQKNHSSTEARLVNGKNSITLELVGVDANAIESFKITLDNYTGNGKMFLDNVRITK